MQAVVARRIGVAGKGLYTVGDARISYQENAKPEKSKEGCLSPRNRGAANGIAFGLNIALHFWLSILSFIV
jgi:hypothetical protein